MKTIQIKGASENNLKQVDISIPHQQFTVITGLSGSGKSSLVRDVLYREGQRMYLETFSSYTRSKLGKVRPAKVSDISGLLPVISIGQTHVQANRRSTAGTFSELSPLLRQLFSRYNDQELPLNRNHFSFNSEKGWCPHCKGLGIEEYIDVDKIVADPQKSLRKGALSITLPNGYTIYSQVTIDELEKVCQSEGFSVDKPWNELTGTQKSTILQGSTKVKVLYGKHSLESRMKWSGMTARPRDESYYKGIVPVMEDILKRDRNDNILRFVSARTCPECDGQKLNKDALSATWKGFGFAEIEHIAFGGLLDLFEQQVIKSESEKLLVQSIIGRLNQLTKLSIGHISADRLSETLSQGELRRMRLAQLNENGLTGVLYIFDEPSIGLHPRDVATLIETMYKLVEKGNTVVVVEHNEQIIRAAQHLIEMGPGAGSFGGQLIFSGPPDELAQKGLKNSPTSQLLSEKNNINTNKSAIAIEKSFNVSIASQFNIKKQQFTFAQHALNVITGVSGAGKSTLVNYGLLNTDAFSQIVSVNQKPIGRTSRSNPATYTGLFDELRKIFAQQSTAKTKKLNASHFSFNSKQGQCEACTGTGVVKTGMHIFEDLVNVCPVCKGSRYKPEILEIKLKGKNIHEILELSINEAFELLNDFPKITSYLRALQKLGLGYLHLGQSSSTLSGGEAQRIKLAASLHKKPAQACLYILDEPTTGLHAADIEWLINALREFILQGHTVVVVEHDEQIIRASDWIVDIGPEGGRNGGKALFCGDTNTFLTQHKSPTTAALKTPTSSSQKRINPKKPAIKLEDITTHNLKGLNIDIEAGQMVAFTGQSGSGKTSLLIDTLHAEGQKLFTENMSGFRRLQIKMHTQGQIGSVTSMMPTVAVESDLPHPDIRTTVASMSGIYDLLRLLYARFAKKPNEKTLTAADFSLVNEYNVCPVCEGAGFEKKCSTGLIITDETNPLLQGALSDHKTVKYFTEEKNKYRWLLISMASAHNINLDLPWEKLEKDQREKVLFGTGNRKYEAEWQFQRKNNTVTHEFTGVWEGLCQLIENEYRTHYPSARGKNALELLSDVKCSSCNGYRLKPEMLEYTFAGRHIGQVLEQSIGDIFQWLSADAYTEVSSALKQQLREKLLFLIDAGLGYLPLGRPAGWLSSGEMKWLRLSSVLSGELSGLCIILDEPSAGMDEKARRHLTKALQTAQQKGNTILLSDHHPELIKSADRLIELGPGAGGAGGQIVADMKPEKISSTNAPIAHHILSPEDFAVRKSTTKKESEQIRVITSATIFAGQFNLITGRTGSGKTQLLKKIGVEAAMADNFTTIFASNKLPQGNTQSAVATRTGLLNDIKKTFADRPEAREKGLKAADFSFNSKKSQCPKCKGQGVVKISLDFLPDVTETCPECNGNRYKDEFLQYTAKGKTLPEWLQLSIDELVKENIWSAKSKKMLEMLQKTGLGYLSPGQETATLSQGERRRLHLAEQLAVLNKERAIILFDSPSSGLDPFNLQKTVQLFHTLAEQGHTVVVADSDIPVQVCDCVINLPFY